MTLPRAYITRRCTGQVRFKLPRQKGDTAFFEQVVQVFTRCPGVDSLQANPLTGSLLIYHRATPDELAKYARQNKLFALAQQPDSPPPSVPRQGEGDLRSMAILLLLVLAAIQLARGSVLGPASTLLWMAWQIATLVSPASSTSPGTSDSEAPD